ncbi:hypothetical protein [Ramlibacter sp.]|uniref:hypothetical protein n=1 Tax=Ramlibacter sp. TaxID=1917967 RepID=UPI002C62F5C8|nr:hypothetical protein [Ramlibacter sp.]HWI82221.1 hypothetical protein [Ramlibacter sp.]
MSVATLFHWARRTPAFAARSWLPSRAEVEPPADDGMVYRLKHWPDLPSASRTADIYRVLSMMSHRPVTRRWMSTHTKLELAQIDQLLTLLVRRGDVEVIDTATFKAA